MYIYIRMLNLLKHISKEADEKSDVKLIDT